jgi:hypothetical protein
MLNCLYSALLKHKRYKTALGISVVKSEKRRSFEKLILKCIWKKTVLKHFMRQVSWMEMNDETMVDDYCW